MKRLILWTVWSSLMNATPIFWAADVGMSHPLASDLGKEFIDAARTGSESRVSEMLTHYPTIIDTQDEEGDTALIWATCRGHENVVAALLEARASLDMQGKGGNTALLMAARCDRMRMVSLLLNAGANYEITDHNDNTPLMCATRWADAEGVLILDMLLASGAQVNVSNKQGETALMSAASKNFLHDCAPIIIKKLLASHAYTALRNNAGKSALDIARETGNAEIIQLLEEHIAQEELDEIMVKPAV